MRIDYPAEPALPAGLSVTVHDLGNTGEPPIPRLVVLAGGELRHLEDTTTVTGWPLALFAADAGDEGVVAGCYVVFDRFVAALVRGPLARVRAHEAEARAHLAAGRPTWRGEEAAALYELWEP